ncbi:dihydroxyacetone kinase subunit DhaK [Aerococcaceae bacterium DSM 111020]|nr:dihydroxyacetone kinase subunit DhaK [Aerococcaceae bacterium DSM 111020]
MKKIINDPEHVVDQMLNGMERAYSHIVERVPNTDVIVRKNPKNNRVGLVSGGGSGHEPAHAGYVGKGMLSAAANGSVFTSPTPDQILEAIKQADEGAGVFLIIKNYSGDVMNFEMAQEMAEMEDIAVASVIVDDDIAVEDSLYTQGRRGVAGTVLVHKILGYYAEKGVSLDELKNIADQLIPNIKTLGIALTGTTTPEGGKESFHLEDDQIEYGVGIHGEPGYQTESLRPSKEMAQELVEKLLSELDVQTDEQLAVLVNGMGGTPLMELYVFTNDIALLLDDDDKTVKYWKVGNYMTSIEMQGLSLTILKLQDKEWLQALNAPVETIGW